MSIIRKGRIAPNKGIPQTDEWKRKVSESKSKNPQTHSDETKKKISESAKKRSKKQIDKPEIDT